MVAENLGTFKALINRTYFFIMIILFGLFFWSWYCYTILSLLSLSLPIICAYLTNARKDLQNIMGPVQCLDVFLRFPKILSHFATSDPTHIQCKPILFWTLYRQSMAAQLNRYLAYNLSYLMELTTLKMTSVIIHRTFLAKL